MKIEFDWKPLLLVPVLALVALPLTGSFSTWLTLTVAGLAMGMIIFIIASGLTLVFGLMDVLNFGHGVFIALGAFVASSVLGLMGDWTGSQELWRNLVAVFPAMLVAMAVAGAVGLAFERFIVRPVYGQHLKQILITMGGMIIGEELIKVIWGPAQVPLPLPEALRGSLLVGDAAISKFLMSPMPGLLVEVAVQPGQQVQAGEKLAVIEAMKMENVLFAAQDGVVGKISAAKGESLAVDQIILEFN